MTKVPYTNTTKNFMHVGAMTIPPGETRDVDASLLPGYKPAAAAPATTAAPPDLIAELLKGSIKNILPELPGMSADDLARAAELEDAGMKRKTLLEAIAAEGLRRLTAIQDASGSGTSSPADNGTSTDSTSSTSDQVKSADDTSANGEAKE